MFFIVALWIALVLINPTPDCDRDAAHLPTCPCLLSGDLATVDHLCLDALPPN
jgi:hypothetical protein